MLFIAQKIGIRSTVKCNNTLPNGSVCNNVLYPTDAECSVCHQSHAMYECNNCHSQIPIYAMKCPSCQKPSFLFDLINIVNGNMEGKNTNSILSELNEFFGINVLVYGTPAILSIESIQEYKVIIQSIINTLLEVIEVLIAFLTDFIPQERGNANTTFSQNPFNIGGYNGNMPLFSPNGIITNTDANNNVPIINPFNNISNPSNFDINVSNEIKDIINEEDFNEIDDNDDEN